MTANWERGDRGVRMLYVSADGQCKTRANLAAAKIPGWHLVLLVNKWTRNDGTMSPGLKISDDQYNELCAERDASYPPRVLPLGKTQLWED